MSATGESESEGEEVLEIDWESLKANLSAGALQSLRQHLQQDVATHAAPTGSEKRAAEESPSPPLRPPPAPNGGSGSDRGNSGIGGGGSSGRQDALSVALPASNLAYKAKDYWDSRFSEEDSYDWLASYSDMAEYLHEAVPKDARVLVVGCGNSDLSADMYDDGYSDLLSTDFSDVVINKMRAKHQTARPRLRWEKMDMLALEAEDASFDAVIDKAAMDALMVDKGDPWNPDPATIERSHRMCTEVSRVLVPGGVFVQLSFEQVHFRSKILLGEHAAAVAAAAASSSTASGATVDDVRIGQHAHEEDSGDGGCLSEGGTGGCTAGTCGCTTFSERAGVLGTFCTF